MKVSLFYRKYLLPGLVFQSIVIGGGYGTGREMIEFFMSKGPVTGYLGMLLTMVIWGLVMAVGFELARMERLYDYRTMLRSLLGKGWVLFEVVFVSTLILVIAVVGSASGEILHQMFGWPKFAGSGVMILAIALLVLKGTKWIESAFSSWSFFLYAVYIVIFFFALSAFGGRILENLRSGPPEFGAALKGGLQYAAYNLGVLPAMLFVARHFETRKEAVTAGLLCGPLAIIPAVLIYSVMLGAYPEVLNEPLPALFTIGPLGAFLSLVFQATLLGTFIETGTGLVHGFNERVAGVLNERNKALQPAGRLAIGLLILFTALVIGNAFGLISIIAKGYGYITWAFWIIFLIPLLTIGTIRIIKKT
ncbi:MAG: hypothetical protein H6562_06915 [Lewinellaceae bacterium]|nr:hypothetical protein [Lewinellaceae bacterium]